MKEVVEGISILKYIDFSYGFDSSKIFECVSLAFVFGGYSSTKKLEQYCKCDICFRLIVSGKISYFD